MVVAISEPLFQYRLFFDKSAESVAKTLNVSVSWIHLTLGMLREVALAPLGMVEKVRTARMFVAEFCVRNDVVNGYIREEGFRGVRHAFAQKHFARALGMSVLAIFLFALGIFREVWKSVRLQPRVAPGDYRN
jgi:hypothetical protein